MSDGTNGPYGQPQYGQPGQPQYGQQPQDGQSSQQEGESGQPLYAPPGQPQYAPPGQPQYAPPGQPHYAPPGQPQYSQPLYGQPGQPQYALPGQYGQPAAYQGYTPGGPPPQNARKKYLLIGVGVLVAVLVLGGIVAAVNGGGSVKDKGKYTIGTPQTVGSFSKIDSAATEAAQSQVRTSLSGVGLLKSGQQAKFEFYGTSGSAVPAFGFIAFDKENSKYPGHDPKSTLKGFFKGATVTNQADKPTGPLGGVLQCGTTASGGSVDRPVCGWADGSSLVGVIFIDSETVDAAAATTLTVRTAVEH